METIAEFSGPALATALVLGLGAGWAFALDSMTFLVSIGSCCACGPASAARCPWRQPMRDDLREGWQAVRSRAWLWSILVCFSAAVLLSFAPWFTLGPSVSKDLYGSTGVFGVLSAAMGAGTIVGALIGFRWKSAAPDAGRDAPGAAVADLLARVRARAAARIVIAAFAIGGVGLALFGIWWETALAERVPPHLLGRVSAYDWMVSLSLLPLGYLVSGPLGEAFGTQRCWRAAPRSGDARARRGAAGAGDVELRRFERLQPSLER